MIPPITTDAWVLYPLRYVAETLYVSVGGLPIAPLTKTLSFSISLIVTSLKSQTTSGKMYDPGSPISYKNCSATVPNDIRPPVFLGLETVKSPFETTSIIGKPMLSKSLTKCQSVKLPPLH